MKQSRRAFLQAFGAGATAVALPELPSMLGWFSFPGGGGENLTATVHSLLLGRGGGGAFVAYADAKVTMAAPQRLLDPPSALLKILDSLGFDRSFSDRIDFGEAAQCRENFERQENVWRDPARFGFNSFTPVKRSASDDEVAIAVAGNIDSDNNLTRAGGATQYRDRPAVSLVGHDPVVAIASRWLLEKNFSGKELAQALAVTEKREVKMENGETATRYETPVTASVYIPRAPLGRRVPNAVALVATHSKKEPNNIYVSELYA